jgi:hypothetical protein
MNETTLEEVEMEIWRCERELREYVKPEGNVYNLIYVMGRLNQLRIKLGELKRAQYLKGEGDDENHFRW